MSPSASSSTLPRLRSIRVCSIALALCAAMAVTTAALAETIVIHADADRAPSDPAAAMVLADVQGALAARDSHLARGDDGGFLSGAQALRAAKRGGLADGVLPWRAYLAFDATEARVVWRVMNTTEERGPDASGRAFLLDATTGEVVSKSDWSIRVR